MKDPILEQLITIGNLCMIALSLRRSGEEVTNGSKLATVIELLFREIQEAVDDFCVEE
uniref:Uncharacterized protein n=1 Tax=viral metagenome TaxID=1070528 RepID=A0A6M3K5E7_9ZZZZ